LLYPVNKLLNYEDLKARLPLPPTLQPLLASIIQLSPNPGVIYLNKISIKNLKSILDFMCFEEAYVDSEDLEEFLAAADMLKVTGFIENYVEKVGDVEDFPKDPTKIKIPSKQEDVDKNENNETLNKKKQKREA
jgi:hypothetical protein